MLSSLTAEKCRNCVSVNSIILLKIILRKFQNIFERLFQIFLLIKFASSQAS